MIANKVKKSGNFTIVDNGYLKDENLSFKAKGILTYFLSLPGDWVIYFDEVITHSKDGIKSFRSGVDELIKEGYIKRYPVRENGVIVRWETEIYESNSQDCQKVEVDKKEIGKEDVGKEGLLSTKNTNTYESKYLNNFSDFDTYKDMWNSLGDRVLPIEKIVGEPRYMFGISKYVEKYGASMVKKTMKSIAYNPFAHRYQVSFDWFLREENFTKLYEKVAKN